MHLAQGAAQIGGQRVKRQGRRDLMASDQHVIPSVLAMFGQDEPGDFTQAPFGTAARHGIANFLGTGKSDTNPAGFAVAAFAGLQVNTRRTLAQRMRGADKISALGQNLQTNGNRRMPLIRFNRRFQNAQVESGAYALSFARPLARRAFRILRPAFVAIRARKP